MIDKCQFNGGLDLYQYHSTAYFRVRESIIKGLNAIEANFEGGFHIEQSQLNGGYNEFDNASFKKRFLIQKSTLTGIISFSEAVFEQFGHEKIEFLETDFISNNIVDTFDFQNTSFKAPLLFKNTHFDTEVIFKHSDFPFVGNTDLSILPTTLEGITLGQYGKIKFLGASKEHKLFSRDTKLQFKEQEQLPNQSILFENVDFHYIDAASKRQLLRLEKLEKVVIGQNCFKYRHKTPVKTIDITTDKQNLVQDWVNTYTNYFVSRNGWDLGIEVIERTTVHFKFFYFTNENIRYEVFLEQLEQTSQSFWVYPHDIQQIEQAKEKATPATYIKIMDVLASIHKLYLQIGVRTEMELFSQDDFLKLLQALPTLQELPQIKLVYQQIIQYYQQKPLSSLSFNQSISAKNTKEEEEE